MKIISISIGTPCDHEFDGKRVKTSIFKRPIDGPVTVRERNIDGDRQADLTVHGGRNKAIYVYSRDYYDEWASELNVQRVEDAQFGENLTISGGTDERIVIGSRYRIGTTEVEVTQPRIPCSKLGLRVNNKSFPARFWTIGHLGFYLRVEREGSIETGQSFELLFKPDHGITVRKLHEIVTSAKSDEAVTALRSLEHIDAGWARRLRAIAKCQSDSHS